MEDAVLFALQRLPQGILRRILLKGSLRMIKSLIIAYPQEMGPLILDAIAPVVSPPTLQVLVEECTRKQLLTPSQVRNAEQEFLTLVSRENPEPAASRPARQ